MSRDEARRLAEYLQHIHEAIVRIERYVRGFDEAGFWPMSWFRTRSFATSK